MQNYWMFNFPPEGDGPRMGPPPTPPPPAPIFSLILSLPGWDAQMWEEPEHTFTVMDAGRSVMHAGKAEQRLWFVPHIYTFGSRAHEEHQARVRAPAAISKIKLCDQLQSSSVHKGIETVAVGYRWCCASRQMKFGYI